MGCTARCRLKCSGDAAGTWLPCLPRRHLHLPYRHVPPACVHTPSHPSSCFFQPSLSTFTITQVGDWLLFSAMGAYTLCGASKFNGIDATAPSTFYIASRH